MTWLFNMMQISQSSLHDWHVRELQCWLIAWGWTRLMGEGKKMWGYDVGERNLGVSKGVGT